MRDVDPWARPRSHALLVAMAPLPTARGNPFIGQMAAELRTGGCALAAASLRSAVTADILHLHWPDHFVNRATAWQSVRGGVKLVLMCAVVRARRRAVVWTVHNLEPHDRRHPRVERPFWPVFHWLVSGHIFLTEAGRAAGAAVLRRGTAATVVAHGSYAGVYPAHPDSPEQARAWLGLPEDSRPLLFFGQIRPYKNVPALLDAFAGIGDRHARLIVAGTGPDDDLIDSIQRSADRDPRVTLTGRVEDGDVHRLACASVGFVLPYRDIFNSGSLFLALSMGRPVLVPSSEVFKETRALVGEEWIEFFEPPLDAADLERFAARAADLVAGARRPNLETFAWERLGPQIIAFYRRLLNDTSGPAGRS